MTWPVLLDYSRDECKRILRKLELEAYASIVSAFRAQGELTKEKKRILQELCSSLSISVERHRAEIRRAVNDEKLGTVAERMVGPNTSMEWAVEGRRLIPLMPRLVPQTAFTALANNFADIQASKNAAMPVPSATGRTLKNEVQSGEDSPEHILKRKNSASGEISATPAKIAAMMPSPTSGIQHATDLNQLSPSISNQQQMILPLSPILTSTPQTNVPLGSFANGHLTLSTSVSSVGTVTLSSSVSTSEAQATSSSLEILTPPSTQVPPVSTSSSPSVSSSTSGTGRGVARSVVTNTGPRPIAPALQSGITQQGTPSKQVILLSGSGATIPPSILQRCLSIPMMKALTSTGTTASTISSSGVSVSKPTTLVSQTLTPVSIPGVNVAGGLSQIGTSGNMVVYTTTTRGRGSRGGTGIRQAVVRPRPSLVVPIHQQAAAASGMHASSALIGLSGLVTSQQTGNMLKTTRGGRGKSIGRGMKIGPQMMMLSSPNTTSTRILPKPSISSSVAAALGISQTSLSSSLSSPLVVMGNSNLQASISKAATMSPTSPRIVNYMSVTPAPNRVGPPANTYSGSAKFAKMAKVTTSNIVTLCGASTTATTSTVSSGLKPNVVIVQKAHAWPQAAQQQQFQLGKPAITKGVRPVKGSTAMTVSKMLSTTQGTKRTITSPIVQTLSSSTNHPIAPLVTESFDATQLDPSNLDPKNTLLADLIQAAGIVLPEGTTATIPVSASSFKTFPSNIASSSLRKIAGLGEFSNVPLTSSASKLNPVYVSSMSKKGIAQPKVTQRNVKVNLSPTKKVITQTIPKLPPSITITQQQSDSDVDDMPVSRKTPMTEGPSVMVADITVPKVMESIKTTSDQAIDQLVTFNESENQTEHTQLIIDGSATGEIVAISANETVSTVPMSSIAVSASEPIYVTSTNTFQPEVFTADITADSTLIGDSSVLQADVYSMSADVSNMVSTTPTDVVQGVTEISSISSSEEAVVLGSDTPVFDGSEHAISFQTDLPQLQEGQVFEIQAPESVIKLLTSGQLTKEVLDLIQSVGIKFDGDTPLTLETTVSEEPERTTEMITMETTHVEGSTTTQPVNSYVLQLNHPESNNQEQPGSSMVEVYDSSGVVQLTEKQLENLGTIEVEHVPDHHVVLEEQQVLTEEISTEVFASSGEANHFVVGECITIDEQNSDLLVSEEIVGSSEMGEISAVEALVLQAQDDQNISVMNSEDTQIGTMDPSGTEAMSLLEKLMEQHKDNFN